jgi:hypothetical protein
MKRKTSLPALLFIVWLSVLALACTLTTSNAPPTLVLGNPLPTDTAQAPIALATTAPEDLPGGQSAAGAVPQGPTGQALINSLLNQVTVDRMIIDIDALQRMVTRHVNSVDGGDRGVREAYRYIHQQMEAIIPLAAGRFRVFDHTFEFEYQDVATRQANIVGWLEGTDTGAGIIIIGAHYDTILRGQIDPEYPSPGANDNGSGVAAMLEIARILSQQPRRATILFVAFAAEEVGRQGSIRFINYLHNQAGGGRYDIRGMFSLDIIGSHTGPNGEINDTTIRLFSDGPNDGPASPSRQLARQSQFIHQRYVTDFFINIEDLADRQGRYSDHLSFSEVGYPAARFIEPLEDLARQHTPDDTLEDIQASYLRQSTQTVLTIVTAMSSGPQPPGNLTLRPNADGTRRLIWEPVPNAARYIIALRRPNALTLNPGESFEWVGNFVDYDGWGQFGSLVIFSVDANGLIGPASAEFVIPP